MMRSLPDNRVHAGLLDGHGGMQCLAASVREVPADSLLWLHLDLRDPGAVDWLSHVANLPTHAAEALMLEQPRPRVMAFPGGFLVVLRGVNLNAGADPEDMVALWLWVADDLIVSVRRRRVMSVQDILAELQSGVGPTGAAGFLSALVERLTDRIGEFVDEHAGVLEELEIRLESDGDDAEVRHALSDLRLKIASARRFLAPQRDAIERLSRVGLPLISEDRAAGLREDADRLTRYLEDLELARERAIVLHEEIVGRHAEAQNARMYVLAIVAAIFLPLGFITGLLGMNVGGMPGADSPFGFAAALTVMAVAAVGVLAYLRLRHWI